MGLDSADYTDNDDTGNTDNTDADNAFVFYNTQCLDKQHFSHFITNL